MAGVEGYEVDNLLLLEFQFSTSTSLSWKSRSGPGFALLQ